MQLSPKRDCFKFNIIQYCISEIIIDHYIANLNTIFEILIRIDFFFQILN